MPSEPAALLVTPLVPEKYPSPAVGRCFPLFGRAGRRFLAAVPPYVLGSQWPIQQRRCVPAVSACGSCACLGGLLKTSQGLAARTCSAWISTASWRANRPRRDCRPKLQTYPGWDGTSFPVWGSVFTSPVARTSMRRRGTAASWSGVERALAELAECQSANGGGFLLATRNGKRIFAESRPATFAFTTACKLNGRMRALLRNGKALLRSATALAGGPVRRKPWTLNGGSEIGWITTLPNSMTPPPKDNGVRVAAGLNWVSGRLYANRQRYLTASKRWRDARDQRSPGTG